MRTLLIGLALAVLSSAPLASGQVLTEVTMAGSENYEDDLPTIAAASDGTLWLAWLAYSDRRDDIVVRPWRDGKWGNMRFVPNTSGDSWLPQAGVDAADRLWVAWTQMLDGNWDVYARSYDPSVEAWGPLHRLTDHPFPDINPRMASDGKGRLALAWQGFRGRHANIYLKTLEPDTGWSETVQVTGRPANDWEPSVAFDSSGTVWVAYDSYANGNYDVFLAGIRDGAVAVPELEVAATGRHEAKPTVAVDGADRVWVAWESGGANWGKDTGFNIRSRQPGVVIGAAREVNIAIYAAGSLRGPAQPLQPVFAAGAGTPKWTYQPHVFANAQGNVVVVAKRLIRHRGERTGTRGYWEYWMTRYAGDAWTPAEQIPNSFGRSSTRTNLANAPDGSAWLAWPTDNRTTAYAHRPIRGEVWVGKLPSAGGASDPTLVPLALGEVEVQAWHPNEGADLDAMRGYRTTVHGRPVQIVRGDFHRHTELSWDGGGGNDGNLQEFYRYMIDAVSMDFGASTDHQGGAYPYWWWYSQKMTDMHHLPGHYTSIFGYERSATQPDGHRNIFFADRSGEVTPFYMRSANNYALGRNPVGDIPPVGSGTLVRDDTKHLYEEVRRMRGIAISHTSGTRMGTDWRDNDPEIEPVVEIMQGARTNYEYVGAPLSAKSGDAKDAPGGYFPIGMVRNAWNKGYRLGTTVSSDHGSTHYSYTMVYTDRVSREGILDAMRRRHTYGATDNILLDMRMGDNFMGDEFRAEAPVPMTVKVRGTNDIASVNVLRGDQILYQHEPQGQEASFEFVDQAARSGMGLQYYYVRVEQADGNVAWGSPIWVNY